MEKEKEARIIDTQTVLSLMARLQFIKKAAHDKAFQSASDARYKGIEIKVTALLDKFEKLIPAVMLAEIGGLQNLVKELYQTLGEQEHNESVGGNNERGN